MSTTGMVMTVTDELLAELDDLASAATPGPWKAVDYGSYDGKMQQFYVDTSFKRADIFESGGDIEPNNNDSDRGAADMQFVACANPSTITALTAELRRLRAENAELAQSLAESRTNDQAAMGWLTSLRWASGDRGERMLPELVSHIEGLAKDAGRYRWIAKRSTYGIDCRQRPSLTLPIYAPDHIDSLGYSIDTALATQ